MKAPTRLPVKAAVNNTDSEARQRTDSDSNFVSNLTRLPLLVEVPGCDVVAVGVYEGHCDMQLRLWVGPSCMPGVSSSFHSELVQSATQHDQPQAPKTVLLHGKAFDLRLRQVPSILLAVGDDSVYSLLVAVGFVGERDSVLVRNWSHRGCWIRDAGSGLAGDHVPELEG